jgi:hypothetical protein
MALMMGGALSVYQRDINYWGQLNRVGRNMLCEETLLEMWPLVLARVNRLEKEDLNSTNRPFGRPSDK